MRSRERAFPKVRFSFDLKFKFKFSSNLQCNVNLCHESFLPYNLDFSQNYETSVSGCLGVQVYWFTVYFSPMLFAQVEGLLGSGEEGGGAWMSGWKLGSMDRISGLFHLPIDEVFLGVITHWS